MTSRRPRIIGLGCLCLIVAAMAMSQGASAAGGNGAGQSRKQLIMLLIHPTAGLASFVKAVSDPSSPGVIARGTREAARGPGTAAH
jgi:hypothetical protein